MALIRDAALLACGTLLRCIPKERVLLICSQVLVSRYESLFANIGGFMATKLAMRVSQPMSRQENVCQGWRAPVARPQRFVATS